MTSQLPVALAQQHLARGDAKAAIAVVDAAIARADTDAMMMAAIWRLVGAPLARDLPAARGLLRRAAAAGHSDAMMMEIALTANGSGAPADWSGALALLETAAAAKVPQAASDLALVRAMGLAEDGSPRALPAVEHLSQAPRIQVFRSAFTPAECEQFAQSIADIIAPSVVVDPATGQHILHPIRTSDGAVIGPTRESLVIAAFNRRLAAMTGTAVSQGEPVQILRYAPGQQYRLHHDAVSGLANQRIMTAIVYLNHGFGGGATEFPDLGIRVTPRTGDTLVFNNVLANGQADQRARHAGLPVTSGVKWIATRWIHAATYDPWTAGG
jgi:prolyl 4-hydroxylase